MKLFLIDAIGPFFRGYQKSAINWSKIPWAHLEVEDGEVRERQFHGIREDFETFCRKVSGLGYNAISLDDVAHLADHELYEPDVRRRIACFRDEFSRLFAIAERFGLAVFLTMDIISYTPRLRERLGTKAEAVRRFLGELIGSFFGYFPKVAGIITRIGESDGKDVRGDFQSELHLRSSRMVRDFLSHVLPVFERHGRKLIFRTWTVGAHSVGDLIWHRSRFRETFDGIESEALIISMKYGESDFFRYLPLNGNFFRSKHAKIVELQARREYEGCGEYPAYVGSDCERFAVELKGADNMVGLSVWCQTGGWVPFRRLAFLKGGEGIWNEINAAVALGIFKRGESAEGALRKYAAGEGIADPDALVELMRLSERAVEGLLYIREFAEQKLFFRRVRIPPLISVYWQHLFVNHSTRKLLRHFVEDTERALREAEEVLATFPVMRDLAERSGLPAGDIDFMRDTFGLFALAREYYFLPFSDRIRGRIKAAKREYKRRWPRSERSRYRIKVDYRPFRIRRLHLGWALNFALRRRRGYRLVDHLITLNLMGLAYRLIVRRRPEMLPKFARESAMGIDAVFR